MYNVVNISRLILYLCFLKFAGLLVYVIVYMLYMRICYNWKILIKY